MKVLEFAVFFVTCFAFVLISVKTKAVRLITVDISNLGAVLGNYDVTSWTNQTFMQFRGIPYAMSPTGDLRFKAPEPYLPWRHVLDATKFGRRCPVITTISKMTEKVSSQELEDCLNLNVYTKNLDGKQPVLFYIYGGGFYNGSASDHPPKYLLEKDIVLIVPQYRIGALGWFSTLTNDMPGNVPILDLLLALQWVQDHIKHFGGDPAKVTVFGQSAGAAMTSAILLSPKTTDGLFKRAIIQSGSILADWAINKNPCEQVRKTCVALNCSSCSNNEELYHCVKNVSVINLLQATEDESFSPIVGDVYGVLPQHPNELMKQYNKTIPIMSGFTRDDGSFVLATYYDTLKKAYGNVSTLTVRQFASGLISMLNDTSHLSDHLLFRLMFSDDLLNNNDHKRALPAYFDLTSTQFIKSPVIAFTSQLVQKHLSNIYMYSFDYEGEHTRFGYEFGNDHYPFNGGIHHSNDNIYLFSTHALNEADTVFAHKMVELWTSFAVVGKPTVSDGTEMLPMSSESGPYFIIDKDISMRNNVLQELTTRVDDPKSQDELDRKDIEF